MSDEIKISFDESPFDSKDRGRDSGSATSSDPTPDAAQQPAAGKVRSGRRSLKEPPNKEVKLPPDEILFKKKYYSIGKVAEMFGEQTSMIRYWENEFDVLKPRKNRKGDRYFRPEDVKILYLINDLLRVRKFTIEGAKNFIKNEKVAVEKFELIESLRKLELFLQQLKDNC